MRIILMLCALSLLAGCGELPRPAPPPPATIAVGEPVRGFAFTTLDATRVASSSLTGKPFVLFFFASWCEY